MDGAPLLRPRQSLLPNPVGIRGVSSDHRGTASQAIKALEASGYLVCQDCTYFGGERCCNPTIASPSLLGVPIQPEDAGLLCVHFQPTSEHNDGAHGLTSAICRKDA